MNSNSGNRPQKPVARRPVAKPVAPAPVPKAAVPAPKPVAPSPKAAPAVKPAASKPGPPRPVAPKPAAPVSAPVSSSGGGGSGGWMFGLLILALAGGAGWLWMNRPQPQPIANDTALPTPEPEVVKPVAPSSPVPIIPIAKAPEPAPAPMPPSTPTAPTVAPAPTPVPVVAAAAADPYAALLTLDSVAARSPAVAERAAKLLRSGIQNDELPKYIDLLRRSLAAEMKRSPDFDTVQRYDRFLENPYFMRAFFQHAVLKMADEKARKAAAEGSLLSSHLVKLCENNDAMKAFLETVTPKDKFRDVMRSWGEIGADDSDAMGEYRDLAIACSLVYEKPHEFKWNGHDTTITAIGRYQWYKKKDKAGHLETRLTKLTAWELCWVVSAPVPESEMEWTLAELRRKMKQQSWGDAYGMVPYDMQKALTGKMKEPYEYYTFAEILKKGGICSDRAYFASNTARSAGIPAMEISGDGPSGPHSWFSWLAGDEKWSFSGRMDGYPAARISDPRNGEGISENVLLKRSDRHAASRAAALKSKQLLWFASLHEDLEQQENSRKAVQYAISSTPYESDLWMRKIELMAASKPPLDAPEWKTFLDAMRRRFSDDPDVLAKVRNAEDTHLFSKLSADSARNELRGDIRHLGNLKGLTSTSEILAAHRRYAEVFEKSKDYASIRRIYREALDDYGTEPAKFNAIVDDYWKFVKGTTDEVKKSAARDIEQYYERQVETKTTDIFAVNSQVGAAKHVARIWREAGDIARAEKIDRDADKRAEKVKKREMNAL